MQVIGESQIQDADITSAVPHFHEGAAGDKPVGPISTKETDEKEGLDPFKLLQESNTSYFEEYQSAFEHVSKRKKKSFLATKSAPFMD
jgi:hypothetical protein